MQTKETFVWLVNLICDFIGQSVKSDSKSGKEQEGERQLWRRRWTFSLIQIDSVFVQEGPGLNGNCFVSRKHIDWYLLFLAEASYYKGKSWRVIDGSIQPGESKPTVFGAAKPARHGGKFRLSRGVGHYYRSFQHGNELLLNKVSYCTMKTCDFYRSDDILTKTAIRACSLTLCKIWKYMIISTQLTNNSLISLNDVWWAPKPRQKCKNKMRKSL